MATIKGSNIQGSQPRQTCKIEVVDGMKPLNGGLQNISQRTQIINTTDKTDGGKGPITKGI